MGLDLDLGLDDLDVDATIEDVQRNVLEMWDVDAALKQSVSSF